MSRTNHLALATLLLAAPLVAQNAQRAGNGIQGVWRVTERVTTGADSGTNSNPQPGLYIFTRRHYSILQINGTTPRAETPTFKVPATPTDSEKVALLEHWTLVTANSGTYTLKGNTLTTRPLVAKNQSVMTGPPQMREAKIQRNTLWLTQRSAAGQPASETRTKLVRVE